MGRNKYSQKEIDDIAKLLQRKIKSKRGQQSEIRHTLRVDYEFNISDFNTPGQSFGPNELEAAIKRGAIKILDDATIESMKAKRARDKARDAANAPLNPTPTIETTDWQEAMKDWEEYYQSHPDEKPE